MSNYVEILTFFTILFANSKEISNKIKKELIILISSDR